METHLVDLIALLAACLAVLPCVLYALNLPLYRSLPHAHSSPAKTGTVSVLIPARDEEGSIAVALEAVLNTVGVDLEVLVLDDGSRDRTVELVASVAQRDSRVTLIPGEPLPPGWCGKQFACWQLARKSRGNVLLFLDADVRIEPRAIPRAIAFLQQQRADLASCVPRQETGTFLERLLIPFILFLLLGFLPLRRMRASRHPAYAAGCGQFLLARRHAYFSCGGHSAIRASLHDGLRLPAAFRAAGLRTDLFDGTDAATCRMYDGARTVWSGLAKNATEGLAAPARILPATVLLLGGQVFPAVLLGAGLLGLLPGFSPSAAGLSFVGASAPLAVRFDAARRFQQPILSGLLHPVGMLLLVAIQWQALFSKLVGRPASWKGRVYRGTAGNLS